MVLRQKGQLGSQVYRIQAVEIRGFVGLVDFGHEGFTGLCEFSGRHERRGGDGAGSELGAQSCYQAAGIEEEVEGVRSAGDEEIRAEDGVEGAAFAVVYCDGQTAGAPHRLEEQRVEMSVAEGHNGAEIEGADEGALLTVMISAGPGKAMDFERETRQRLPDRAESISGDDVDIQLLRERGEGGPHAGGEPPGAGERAGKIAG